MYARKVILYSLERGELDPSDELNIIII